MAKLPPKIGPVVVKDPMLTGKQFFARQEARRGTRMALDEALSLALWARDENRLPRMVRDIFAADLALVLKARDDDPLGITPPSPEVLEACGRLSEIGKTARNQTETMRHAEAETSARVKAEKERAGARVKRAKKESAARAQAEIINRRASQGGRGRTVITTNGAKVLKAICAKKGWLIDTLDKLKELQKNSHRKKKLAEELQMLQATIKTVSPDTIKKVSLDTIRRYLKAWEKDFLALS